VQSTIRTLGILELVVCVDEQVLLAPSADLGGEVETGSTSRDEKGVVIGVEMSVAREMVVYVNALWSGWPI
jgi:hypothetical protein